MQNTSVGLTVNGDVEAFDSAVEVINLIAGAQQSGCLVFSPEDGRRYLCFEKGEIIGAASDSTLEGFGVYLLRAGISREMLHKVANEHKHLKRNLSAIFSQRKLADEARFRGLLEGYTKEMIYAVLGIKKGHFQLIPFNPDVLPVPFKINLQATLMEGLCRLDESEHFQSEITDRFTRLGRTDKAPDISSFSAHQQLVWQALERASCIEVLGQQTNLNEFEATKAAFQLMKQGLVEAHPDTEEEATARSAATAPKPPEPLQHLFDVDVLKIPDREAGKPKGMLCPRCWRTFPLEVKRCPHDRKDLVINRKDQVLLERYKLTSLLGVGGMGGTVWEGRQLTTERPVAIKLFPGGDEEEVGRFARGARLASHLNHPHITTVHDYGQEKDGTLVLVMELLKGVSLATRLKGVGSLPLDQALRITNQLLRALEAAHNQRAVHRDLKPDNLFLISQDGYTDHVKVNDFGIAKYEEGEDEESEVTTARKICGTPRYMAPEQVVDGKIDARTDLYSVGVVLFRMITGQTPFAQKETRTLFRQILTQAPPRMSDMREELEVPEQLEQFVARALEKDPKDRFASAREMRASLYAVRMALGYIDEEESQALSMAQSHVISQILEQSGLELSAVSQRYQPNRTQPLIIGLLLLVIAGGGVYFVTRSAPGEASAPRQAQGEAPEPEPVKKQKLNLSSTPPGALVKLEGSVMGRTPLTTELPSGTYVFELSAEGHGPQRVEVEFTGGDADIQRVVTLRALGEDVQDAGAELSEEVRRQLEEAAAMRAKLERIEAEKAARQRAEERKSRRDKTRKRSRAKARAAKEAKQDKPEPPAVEAPEPKPEPKPRRPKLVPIEDDRPHINMLD